jgi:anhydro-N-acetylmuramic acid kinase
MTLTLGLMSGTSLDGVDGVLLHQDPSTSRMQVQAHVHQAFPAALRAELAALQQPGPNELHRAALASNAVAEAYAAVTALLLAKTSRQASDITAIGAHGQTVRHQPQAAADGGTGYTLQLLNGALLAERTGIDVVCDLRSRDVAAGGQGAPLVPAFHAAAFGNTGNASHAHNATTARAVVNIGGMANITLLPAGSSSRSDHQVQGFDTGPGGALLDGWCDRHHQCPFDDGGRWAASGHVHAALLQHWLADPFFTRQPPKSTGRDHFHMAWVDAGVHAVLHAGMHAGMQAASQAASPTPSPTPADVQATLSELTAATIVNALGAAAATSDLTLIVCGGGARNTDLLRRLQARAPRITLQSSADHGIAVDQVEAAAFAWLAHAFVARLPGNRPAVTGAKGLRVLGALHPGVKPINS